MANVEYDVSFTGTASDTLRAAFFDCGVIIGDGTTTLRCAHGALHDVLGRIQDLGLELRDVRLVAAPGSDKL